MGLGVSIATQGWVTGCLPSGAHPSVPTLHGVTGSGTTATLEITPSINDYNHSMIGVMQYMPTAATSFTFTKYTGTAGTRGNTTITGLTQGYTYYFIIYDVSALGAKSAPSMVIKAYMEPSAGAAWYCHDLDVINEWIRVINASTFKTGGTVEKVVRGALEYLPNMGLLSTYVPCVFIQPLYTRRTQRTLSANIVETVFQRFVYVFTFKGAEKIISKKMTDIRHLVKVVEENFALTELSLSNGQVKKSWIDDIEYRPIEDEFCAQKEVTIQATACAINVMTEVYCDR